MAGIKVKPGEIVIIKGIRYMALDNWGTPACKNCDLNGSGCCDIYDCLSGVYFVKEENVTDTMRKLFT